jgi:tetratricopeptide (TPR) repeat protein
MTVSSAALALTGMLAFLPASTSGSPGSIGRVHESDDDALPPALLGLAAKLFQDGNYAGAADVYDRFSRHGIANGGFFFNQGNAHFLAGHLPEAILAYRRAERWIPNDPRLQANLADARTRVLEPPDAPATLWPGWLPRLSRPLHARLILASSVAGWLGVLLWIWRRGRTGIICAIAFWSLDVILLGILSRAEWEDARRPLAVVAADEVVLRKGNGDAYPAREIHSIAVRLNRGVEARVLGSRPNGWLQIELADGLVGWVPRSQALLDRDYE